MRWRKERKLIISSRITLLIHINLFWGNAKAWLTFADILGQILYSNDYSTLMSEGATAANSKSWNRSGGIEILDPVQFFGRVLPPKKFKSSTAESRRFWSERSKVEWQAASALKKFLAPQRISLPRPIVRPVIKAKLARQVQPPPLALNVCLTMLPRLALQKIIIL